MVLEWSIRNPQSGEAELSIDVLPRPEFKNYFSTEYALQSQSSQARFSREFCCESAGSHNSGSPLALSRLPVRRLSIHGKKLSETSFWLTTRLAELLLDGPRG